MSVKPFSRYSEKFLNLKSLDPLAMINIAFYVHQSSNTIVSSKAKFADKLQQYLNNSSYSTIIFVLSYLSHEVYSHLGKSIQIHRLCCQV